MIRYCYVGAADPDALTINVAPSSTIPDLTVVTAAEITVTLRDGTQRVWSADITEQSAAAMVLVHVFASDGSDVDRAGVYRCVLRLTTPGGIRECLAFDLPVRTN